MNLTAYEHETTIILNDADEYAIVYTCQKPMITKMDKMCKSNPDSYKLVKQDEWSKTYHIDKELIGFRSPREKKELTEEQKLELQERGRRLAQFKQSKINS